MSLDALQPLTTTAPPVFNINMPGFSNSTAKSTYEQCMQLGGSSDQCVQNAFSSQGYDVQIGDNGSTPVQGNSGFLDSALCSMGLGHCATVSARDANGNTSNVVQLPNDSVDRSIRNFKSAFSVSRWATIGLGAIFIFGAMFMFGFASFDLEPIEALAENKQ